MVRTRVGCMLGAPRSRSADARRGAGGAWRLKAPTPAGVAAVSVGQRLQTVYDERFAREYGPWRPVVAQVADKFLACGEVAPGSPSMRRSVKCARSLSGAPSRSA